MADVCEAFLSVLSVLWTEFSYYYCPFSCFSEKILSKAKSYRMRFFASSEATTIAEPPEPSRFSGAKSLKLKA